MKLFKYISSEDALKNIINGKIKFATLDSLNDPTELLPKIYEKELLQSLKNKRIKGYTKEDLIDLKRQELLFKKLSPETMVINAPKSIEIANSIISNPIYDNLNYLKDKFSKTVEFMASRCGIFCVSTRKNSLPMWAHYANNAKGFVIEFNNLEKTYNGDGTGILYEIKDIVYRKKRSGINFESESYNSLFFEKDEDWKYESEKRIIVDLKSCTKLRINDNFDIFTQEINKEYISSVIFGWKISQEKISELSNELLSINPNISISISKIENGMIKI